MTSQKCRTFFVVLVAAMLAMQLYAANRWRSATESELRSWIPARVPVVKERIEIESRTMSGIVDDKGQYVAGAVLITAGYSANGKYSNFLVTQVPLKTGTALLRPGEYVLGWHHVGDSLDVLFYEANSGRFLGEASANRDDTHRRIESFQILPPDEHSIMLIGRYAFHYKIVK